MKRISRATSNQNRYVGSRRQAPQKPAFSHPRAQKQQRHAHEAAQEREQREGERESKAAGMAGQHNPDTDQRGGDEQDVEHRRRRVDLLRQRDDGQHLQARGELFAFAVTFSP